jgi:hypothetical protein
MSGVFAAQYFLSPPHIGTGAFVLERWQVYVLLTAVMWIASVLRGGLEQTLLQVGAAIVSLMLAGIVVHDQVAINRELSDYLSVGDAVQAGTTILPVQFDSRGAGRLGRLFGMPMRHAANYLAIERGALNLDNYEAESGHFPLLFGPAVDPAVFMERVEEEPPAPDVLGYSRKTGCAVEFVLVWDPLGSAGPAASGIERQLQDAYVLVQRSRTGACRLDRMRASGAPAP